MSVTNYTTTKAIKDSTVKHMSTNTMTVCGYYRAYTLQGSIKGTQRIREVRCRELVSRKAEEVILYKNLTTRGDI